MKVYRHDSYPSLYIPFALENNNHNNEVIIGMFIYQIFKDNRQVHFNFYKRIKKREVLDLIKSGNYCIATTNKLLFSRCVGDIPREEIARALPKYMTPENNTYSVGESDLPEDNSMFIIPRITLNQIIP